MILAIKLYMPFDVATYQPRTHVPPPGGILRFEGFIPGMDEDTLLQEPMEHVSADASTVIAKRIGGYGSISGPRRWYERLPAEPATTDELAQYTRGFLIYLLGTTLGTGTPFQVVEYDWGGAGLATLYCYMSSVSRRKADSLGGYWRVWELWVYTYFTSLAPVLVRPIELSVPRSRYYNLWFERRRLVDWHPWAGISQVSRKTYTTAWHASTMRILFEDPFGRVYYLIERFFGQTWGVADPDIPHPPPPGIKVVDDLQDSPELDLLMIGEDGDRHVSVITKVASAWELGYDWGRSLREHPCSPNQRSASTSYDI
ncbi:hypothetical protein CsSME_00043416 [Camellia sinensis var. sinensis]